MDIQWLAYGVIAYCCIYFALRPKAFQDAWRARYSAEYSQIDFLRDHPKVAVPAVVAVLALLGIVASRLL